MHRSANNRARLIAALDKNLSLAMKDSVIRVLKRVPFVYIGYQTVIGLEYRRNQEILCRQLAICPDQQARNLRLALAAFRKGGNTTDRLWIDKIEECRTAMLSSCDPLVDWTLGEPGIYDGGNKTIRDACSVSKARRPASFLYLLARFFKPRQVLELGTNVGISSAYLAAGIAEYSDGGQLVTLESSKYRQRIAKQLHSDINLSNVTYVPGLFCETLSSTLTEFPQVDLAFIDGHHQYQPTLDYLNAVVPYSSPGCVYIFDDIRYSEGMMRAWKEIRNDSRFGVVIDLFSVGLCVLRKPEVKKRLLSQPRKIF